MSLAQLRSGGRSVWLEGREQRPERRFRADEGRPSAVVWTVVCPLSAVGPGEGFEQWMEAFDWCSERIRHCYVGILLGREQKQVQCGSQSGNNPGKISRWLQLRWATGGAWSWWQTSRKRKISQKPLLKILRAPTPFLGTQEPHQMGILERIQRCLASGKKEKYALTRRTIMALDQRPCPSKLSHRGTNCCSNDKLPSHPTGPLIRMPCALGSTPDQSRRCIALSTWYAWGSLFSCCCCYC